MQPLGNNFPNIFIKQSKSRTALYTRNLTPGQSVYGESFSHDEGIEYREWDPTRSKLAAALLKEVSQVGLRPGATVLYLGASTGTTVSHVSDIVGEEGMVYAIDIAPRVLRDLVFLAEKRKNISPILGDANRPATYMPYITSADFLYQDVAQRNQAEIFLKNARMFLKPECFGFLCVKAKSIDIARPVKQIYAEIRQMLEKELTIVDFRILDPFEKDHCAYVCKKK